MAHTENALATVIEPAKREHHPSHEKGDVRRGDNHFRSPALGLSPQFVHEILNANPYAYLDEAGLEKRRARATSLGRNHPDQPGKVDPVAIAAIRKEIWPDFRDQHELHDLLHSLIVFPLHMLDDSEARNWHNFYDRLVSTGREKTIDCFGSDC